MRVKVVGGIVCVYREREMENVCGEGEGVCFEIETEGVCVAIEKGCVER